MGLFRLLLVGLLVYLGFRIYRLLRARPEARRPADRTAPPESDARSPHEVLGVSTDATPEQIRAAYQKQIRQYHPDRVADMGPELRDLAEQHTKELNAAYDALQRG